MEKKKARFYGGTNKFLSIMRGDDMEKHKRNRRRTGAAQDGGGGRMIQVEGYKAFFGMMDCGGRMVWGEWLYKPGTDCWYCRGSSYPAEMCRIVSIE